MSLKVYAVTGFKGYYPVGSAAVVVAETQDQALLLLNQVLMGMGLPPTNFEVCHMEEIDRRLPTVKVLVDGDY